MTGTLHKVNLAEEAVSLLDALGVAAPYYRSGGLPARSPITGEAVAHVHEISPAEAKRAIDDAHAAFLVWRNVPAPKRGELVRLLGEELRANKNALGRLVSIEVGKIVSEGLGEVQEMIDICDFAVGLSRQLHGLTIATEREEHRILSCPAYPDGHRFAQRPGLRRARAGEQRADVGATGLAHGPDLPAHADAVDGRVLPHLHRRAHRADRARGHRARPARDDVAVRGRDALHDADLAARREVERAAARAHGQVVPARHPPDDDLRVRRRLGARVDHERAHADEEPGRDPRPRRRARPVHVHGAAARRAREVQRASGARSSRSGSATTSSPRSRSTTTRSRRSSRPTSSSRTRS